MNISSCASGKEPQIAVGLVQNLKSAAFWLSDDFVSSNGQRFPKGEYLVELKDRLMVKGPVSYEGERLSVRSAEKSPFQIEATIGVDFHWQQKERQSFNGDLMLKPDSKGCFTIINDVSLENYLTSVICSEMSATSDKQFLKAHAVISRSWLLAQVDGSIPSEKMPEPTSDSKICWYDRKDHSDFDVCADDHCQRYQGINRIKSPSVEAAIEEKR